MLHRLAYLLRRLHSSIWLIPVVCCAVSVSLGLAILWVDRHAAYQFSGLQMFAMSVDSARQVLSVIAGSVISVSAVSFSITMVALTLTSGQHGPKIVRHFLEDNDSKISLGLFLGTYVYTLVVLSGYNEADRPHLTVLTALLLALLAVVGFVRFIHRIATDMQADEIVQRIGMSLCDALHKTVKATRDSRTQDLRAWRRQARGKPKHPIAHLEHGYVQSIDYAGLVQWCHDHDSCIQVRARAGDFVVEGLCVFKLFGHSSQDAEETLQVLGRHLVVGPTRTSAQDPEFPITQLNQVAARALSPGINDPGTAISCVDSFCLALAQIVDTDLPGPVFNDAQGTPRLLAKTTDFAGLLKAVFAPLRQFAQTDIPVTISLLTALGRLAELTTRNKRLALLGMHGQLITEGFDNQALADFDRRDIRQRAQRLQALVHRFDDAGSSA